MSEKKYSKKHLWVEIEENIATIGITDYAQEKLGNVLFINLPEYEDKIFIGTALGDIESTKTVSDLISPVSGTVTDVNEELIDEPDVINDTPYESWLIRVEVSAEDTELMSEAEYEEYIKTI
jgi:glycine cleavage system H protein